MCAKVFIRAKAHLSLSFYLFGGTVIFLVINQRVIYMRTCQFVLNFNKISEFSSRLHLVLW